MCCDQIKFCFKALYYYLTEIKSRNDFYEKGIPMTENICCSTLRYLLKIRIYLRFTKETWWASESRSAPAYFCRFFGDF